MSEILAVSATAETRSNRRLDLRSVGAAPFGAALSGTQAATAMKRDAYPPTHLPSWPRTARGVRLLWHVAERAAPGITESPPLFGDSALFTVTDCNCSVTSCYLPLSPPSKKNCKTSPGPVHSAARRVTREGRLGISRCASQFGCRLTLGDSASAPGWGVCALLRIRTHTHTHCAQLQDRRIDSRRRRRGWRRCAGGHRCRCAGGHRRGRRGPHRKPPGAARLYCAEYHVICFVCRIASAVHRVPVRFIIIAVMMINCIAMYHFVFSGHHTI